MTIIFPAIQVITLLACLPAYRVARRRQAEPVWALFLIAPGLLTWIGLTMYGVGSQSLSNIIELFDLMLGTILLYYFKVFMLDRSNPSPLFNNLVVIVITIIAAVLLRLFMPALPE